MCSHHATKSQWDERRRPTFIVWMLGTRRNIVVNDVTGGRGPIYNNGQRKSPLMANGDHGTCPDHVLYAKATKYTTNGHLCPTTHRRRTIFPQRLMKTTSVLVTVAFVAIFIFIVAMEVFFIDESKRLKARSKEPEATINSGHDPPVLPEQLPPVGAVLTVNGRKDHIPSIAPALHITGRFDGTALENESTHGIYMNNLVLPRPDYQDVPASKTDDTKLAARRALHQETLPFHQGVLPATSTSTQKISIESKWTPASNSSPSMVAIADWQPVLGANDKFYVYSAFLDVRQGSFIRIVATTRTRGSDKVHCVYWYTSVEAGNATRWIVPATNKIIRENWNLKYSATFVVCPLFLYKLGRKIPVPDMVSVVISRAVSPSGTLLPTAAVGNWLRVLNKNGGTTATGVGPEVDSFAVCVKPLHYQFNRATQLIEFIELNRILGVKHFTFYNHTIGPEVDCVLRSYVNQGLVTLLPWKLDIVSQKEIRTEGLFAAINDCLYRNMYRYRYLLMIDIDEYIVPHRNNSLGSVISELLKRVDRLKAGSFSFMNSFFYLQWPNDINSKDLPALVTLQKTRRRAKFHPHKQRSKCIVVPRFVVEMGNHFVWEFLPGKGAVNVPPDVAFLHHYRVCEFGGNDCIKTQAVTDRTVYRYKTQLVQRVLHRLNASRTEGPMECRGLHYELQLRR